MKQPQRVYRWTLAAWVLVVVLHLALYLVEASQWPSSDEVYTQLVSFQVVVFALTVLPYWLGGLLLVLIVEFAAFGRVLRNRPRGDLSQ
ncbi:hypothetical protein [Ramlibacter albus]|uniref:Uncharacterized protein n=1 Tax=Ramlibacter albus TaxID=2079448 RepID=A0A923M7L9_9BURK|nr:hypothetical protein [Ramlibacter albus]MBC5765226.1 hypothetical protein [Ramlibacter albus]